MLTNLQGIVFRTVKYKESSVISSIYTDRFGLRSYLMNGVRSPKSRVSPSLFQPGFLVDMVVYHKDGNPINRIKEIRSGYHYKSEVFDLFKGAVSLFFSEICIKTIHEQEYNPGLFNFLKNTFIQLDTEQNGVANYPIVFLIKLSAFLGFAPNFTAYSTCSLFDLEEGEFVNVSPSHFNYLDETLTVDFKKLIRIEFKNCCQIKVEKGIREELLNKMIMYYRIHIDDMKEITSHHIFHQVFAG